jgi:hypothetical protein
VLLHLEKRRHRFHPDPQILQAQVLIGSMLIFVVVGAVFLSGKPLATRSALD